MARSQKKIAGDETVHYVSARKERESRKKHASTAIQPPLTPMIDIVFQLLLFFLLACQFRADEGQIAANLPDISGPPPKTISVDPIDITLRAAGSDDLGVLITVQHTDAPLTTAEELYNYLMQMKPRHGEKADGPSEVPVTIKPLGNVRWNHVVNAFNQAIRADYKKVGFKPSG